MKYNTKVVLAYFRECGLSEPVPEFKFHPERNWKFDFAWPRHEIERLHAQDKTHIGWNYKIMGGLALEVQGGLFTDGRHTRGPALLKEYEKLNYAAMHGFLIMFCQPKDLLKLSTIEMIKKALAI